MNNISILIRLLINKSDLDRTLVSSSNKEGDSLSSFVITKLMIFSSGSSSIVSVHSSVSTSSKIVRFYPGLISLLVIV